MFQDLQDYLVHPANLVNPAPFIRIGCRFELVVSKLPFY